MRKLLLFFVGDRHYSRWAMYWQVAQWRTRDFRPPAPPRLKHEVLEFHAVPSGVWIETGTHVGTTTEFLAKNFPHVHSLEPSPSYFSSAKEKFQGRNVSLYNSTSEALLPVLLPKLSGDLNFWLDAHFSGGDTFRGKLDTPIVQELEAIAENLGAFGLVTICVDDVRCFTGYNPKYETYPSLDFLANWAKTNGFQWTIEHDIFIMKRSMESSG
jgi:hypothetical protein